MRTFVWRVIHSSRLSEAMQRPLAPTHKLWLDTRMLKATFRQLETFVVVVESGSFTNAAGRLGISPAAISDQIRALEQRMDCTLFDRRPGTTPVLNERG